MAINFGKEYRRFAVEMKKKHKLYTQLNMSQEQIDALDEFDREEFLSNIRYMRRALPMCIDGNPDTQEELLPLYQKFGDVLTVELKLTFREKCDWLEDITSAGLKKKLLSLSPRDLEILDFYVFEENTQKEIAEKLGITQQAVQKRLKKITEVLAAEQEEKIF